MRVRVLGAGVTGLTTAIRLQETGHRVEVVSASAIEELTSYLAAAVWFPTHVGPPDRVRTWGGRTFDVLVEQAGRGVPGVVMRESMALYREPPGEEDWADAVGGVRAAGRAELPPGYEHGLRFAVPLVEMPLYLPWLVDRFRGNGGTVTYHRVRSLHELAADTVDVVVNCSGLAARELAGDDAVHPVRGQIVRATNPGLTMSVRDEAHPDGRAYVHPRTDDVILGGTLDVGSWDTRVDLVAADAILRRCRDIVPDLARSEVIEHLVGLRPGRREVRLDEAEPIGERTRLLHNYGHGGAGITLAWGCAEEVGARLAT